MEEDFKRIDIAKWKQVGNGGNGVVYESLETPDVLLKLDLWGRADKMRHEFENARRVAAMGMRTPEVYELATDGKRFGYTCRRIRGKKSYCRVIADDPSRLDEMAQRFAEHAKSLHSTECDITFFPSRLQNSIEMLRKIKYIEPEMLDEVIRRISSIPERTTCLHGDFHFGNIITADSGDWWIDLDRFSYGNPLYDFSQFYFLLFYLPGIVCKSIFHVTKVQGQEFFRKTIEYYFQPQTDTERAEIYRQLETYVLQYLTGIMKNRILALIFLPKLKKQLQL